MNEQFLWTGLLFMLVAVGAFIASSVTRGAVGKVLVFTGAGAAIASVAAFLMGIWA